MKTQFITAVALASALSATSVLAGIANGALVDADKQAVSSSYTKCVIVSLGADSEKCHDAKPAPVVAPKPVAKPAPKPVVPEVMSEVALSGDALFALDSDQLSAVGRAELDEFVARVSILKVTHIDVVGHADSQGNAAYNQGLSERRAEAVKAYLVSKGANPSAVSTSGQGENSPIASNDTAEGRAQNRRVEITVKGFRK